MKSLSETHSCPLCRSPDTSAYESALGRDFLQCLDCELVFLDPQQRLGPDEEASRYELHENHDSPGYRQFLYRMVEQVEKRIPKDSSGLDYGCGPNPLLAKMLQEKGYTCDHYDPLYFPSGKKNESYDFLLLSEVIEHFRDVRKEFELIKPLLKPESLIVISSSWLPEDFANWHYHRDPTHISFYNTRSLREVSKLLEKYVEKVSKNLAVLKPSPS